MLETIGRHKYLLREMKETPFPGFQQNVRCDSVRALSTSVSNTTILLHPENRKTLCPVWDIRFSMRRSPDSNRGNNGFAIRRLRPLGYCAEGAVKIGFADNELW